MLWFLGMLIKILLMWLSLNGKPSILPFSPNLMSIITVLNETYDPTGQASCSSEGTLGQSIELSVICFTEHRKVLKCLSYIYRSFFNLSEGILTSSFRFNYLEVINNFYKRMRRILALVWKDQTAIKCSISRLWSWPLAQLSVYKHNRIPESR